MGRGWSIYRIPAELRLWLAALLIGWTMPVAFAQQAQESPSPGRSRGIDPVLVQKLAEAGDLTLRDMTLRDALLTIGTQWQINLILGAKVEGHVSGTFESAPLSEILDAVLLSNGYSYRPVGRTLVIVPLDELGHLNPLFQNAVIPVEQGEASEVLEAARMLSSPQGKVEAIASVRSLLVIDFPDRVEMIRHFIHDINATSAKLTADHRSLGPQQFDILALEPQYVPAPSLEKAIAALLSEEGKVIVVEGENRILVTDYAERLETVRRSLAKLDIPRRQVRIVSLIYDIDLEDMEELGINWSSDVQGRQNGDGEAQSIFSADSLLQAAAAPGSPGSAFTFFNLSRHFNLNTVVRALHESKYSRLLADPSVTVVENQQALISIVEEIPFQQLTQTSAGGNIGTTAFREAGVKLEVTPRIADDGTIEMKVTPSFSRLTGFTPGDNPQPIIDKRETQTVVRIANTQTLVIGGLRSRQDIKKRNGVPYLERIKTFHLGLLFRGHDIQARESELVVFLRPEIVSFSSSGLQREMQAAEVGRVMLDQIPTASIGPAHCVPLPPVGTGEVIIHSETIDRPVTDGALPIPAEVPEVGPSQSVRPPAPPTVEEVNGRQTPPQPGPSLRGSGPNSVIIVPSRQAAMPLRQRLPNVDRSAMAAEYGNRTAAPDQSAAGVGISRGQPPPPRPTGERPRLAQRTSYDEPRRPPVRQAARPSGFLDRMFRR